MDNKIISDFESFLTNEYLLFEEYKDIYNSFPAIVGGNRKIRQPQSRGINTINALFNKLRAFFNWCLENELTSNRPFKTLNPNPIYIEHHFILQ